MKSNIIAATILGLCLIAAGFMIGGRYYFMRVDDCTVARGDRWTGQVDRTFLSDKCFDEAFLDGR